MMEAGAGIGLWEILIIAGVIGVIIVGLGLAGLLAYFLIRAATRKNDQKTG